MAKPKTSFVCQSCGAVHPRWAGRCESCGAWNAILEDAAPPPAAAGARPARSRAAAFVGLDGGAADPQRRSTGVAEFDRVLGGGLVPGAAVLVGGDPGVGKSTLLLQTAAKMTATGGVAYVSGEEAAAQVRLRAQRLGVADAPVKLAAATAVGEILATLETSDGLDLVVIDSIQTLWLESLESAPGSVAQVRASAQALIHAAKRKGFALVLVGHVTKDGAIAGPRVLEHMVDAVLQFEGDRAHLFRILRALKNRFGPTDEIGVFEMRDAGMAETPNPSVLFLGERGEPASGSAVFAGVEGTRPVLVDIQALLAPAAYGAPRRAAVGWDGARLAMILAVLEARCGLPLGGRDVYLNVAGGYRVHEPAADLAVAAAVMSSLADRPTPGDVVVFGEIALSGAVRQVSRAETRLKEAQKLGFERAWAPPLRVGAACAQITGIQHVADLAALIGVAADDGFQSKSRGR